MKRKLKQNKRNYFNSLNYYHHCYVNTSSSNGNNSCIKWIIWTCKQCDETMGRRTGKRGKYRQCNDNYIQDMVGQYVGDGSGNGATPGERVTENTKYKKDGKTATIPAKFTVSGLI